MGTKGYANISMPSGLRFLQSFSQLSLHAHGLVPQ